MTMQNLAILTAQNQVSKSQGSRNAESGGASSKNNEPNISFKEMLSNQAKPAEPAKPQEPAKKAEQANTADAPTAETTNNEASKASATSQSANNGEANEVPAKSTDAENGANKNVGGKNAVNVKTKPQLKVEKDSDTSAENLQKSTTNTIAVDDVTAKLADTKPHIEDKTESQQAIATDANAAFIASLNLPAKDFLNANLTAINSATINSAIAGKTEATSTVATVDLKTLGEETSKKSIEPGFTDKKPAMADQLPAGDIQAKTVTTQNLVTNGGFNAQLEQRLNAKLLTQENLDKTLTPALTALTSQTAPAMLANNTNAAQAAAMNSINAYPGKTGWDEAISQKVVWMVGAEEQTATLTLNPPDLGPLQVVINVNNDKADTTFISQNPEVRKALESGMSNLRQLMDQAGVQLGQTNVNDGRQSAFFQQANREQPSRQSSSNAMTETNTVAISSPRVSRINNGLVDTFA